MLARQSTRGSAVHSSLAAPNSHQARSRATYSRSLPLMRSVLIASRADDVGILREALLGEGLESSSSQSIAAGAALADSLPNDVVAAVAVLPTSSVGLSAVLVETGVALGRGLPLMLIVSPGSEIPAALVGVRTVIADLDNRDALRFQARMFVQSLKAPGSDQTAPLPTAAPLAPTQIKEFRSGLDRITSNSGSEAASEAFEHWVLGVLRAGGATVEQDRRYALDQGIDAAVSIPGEEHRLGPLLVEAKVFRGPPRLRPGTRQLVSQVLARGAGLGLLIYASSEPDLDPETTPRVISLWAADLISQLERTSLAEVLVKARNEAIHRL